MLAPPAVAARMVMERGVAFIMICDGLSETRLLAARAPDGLAAALIDHRVPAWLAVVPLRGTPFSVFKVLPIKAEEHLFDPPRL